MRLLFLEDDQYVADYTVRSLTAAGFEVVQVFDIPDAKKAVAKYTFDALILDRLVPSGDSLSFAKDLQSSGHIPILFLSALDSIEDKITGLTMADDYLAKPFSADELIARVHALLRRTSAYSPVLTCAGISLHRLERSVYRGTTEIHLNPVEFKLLDYLLLHKNQVVSRQMLLENVWEYSFEPATSIVETYISRLRKKLDFSGLAQPISTVRNAGYIISDD